MRVEYNTCDHCGNKLEYEQDEDYIYIENNDHVDICENCLTKVLKEMGIPKKNEKDNICDWCGLRIEKKEWSEIRIVNRNYGGIYKSCAKCVKKAERIIL